MTSLQATLITAAIAFGIVGAVAAFDYQVDPMCYYHCDRVDISKKTANFYYQAAQKEAVSEANLPSPTQWGKGGVTLGGPMRPAGSGFSQVAIIIQLI